jgi:NADH dehydrogenase FAD-containing subunit
MVQGDIIARNVAARINGGEMTKYEFMRAGEIVTLGRTNAIGDLFGLHFSGPCHDEEIHTFVVCEFDRWTWAP